MLFISQTAPSWRPSSASPGSATTPLSSPSTGGTWRPKSSAPFTKACSNSRRASHSDGRGFAFAEGLETKGNERKKSGSYYTPDSLVQALLDSALDPVLDRVESEAEDAAAALLGVTVIDPACGSGHFLLAAARRIATRVARVRTGGVPSTADYRHALRDAVRCCIHGVDRNPMAVELARVALWIETVEPGKPLGFLDANIRVGDSLLGHLLAR